MGNCRCCVVVGNSIVGWVCIVGNRSVLFGFRRGTPQRNNATCGRWRNSDTAYCVVYHQHLSKHRCSMGVTHVINAGDDCNLSILKISMIQVPALLQIYEADPGTIATEEPPGVSSVDTIRCCILIVLL